MAGLGTGWNKAQFDNLVIKKSKDQVVSAVLGHKGKTTTNISAELRRAFLNRSVLALQGPVRVEIICLDGRVLHTFSIGNNRAGTVDFTKVNPGAYVVRFRTNNSDILHQSCMVAR
jgi:hypothetical protein